MGVRKNKPVNRTDGGPWLSGRTTVRQDFPKFSLRNLSCIRTSSGRDGSIVRTDARPLQVIFITGFARPDQGVGASGRLNFNTQFPYLIRVRPDHKGETSGRLKSNPQLPYTMHQRPDHSCQMSGRFILNCDSCLTEISVGTGYHIVRKIDWSSLSWTWKESVNRSRTDRRPGVLLKRPDGASWHKSFSIWCRCPDGKTRLPDGWNSRQMDVRTGWHIVRTTDRELWNSSDFTLNSEIPVCSILTYKWFCPNT
jgi:hypothetical protein